MIVVSYKCKVPREHWLKLDALKELARPVLGRMIANPDKRSTKYYKELPSVVAKGLISKYQANPKCRVVRRIALPIHGDSGKKVKIVPSGLRVYALFKDAVIPCGFPLPVAGFVRHVEFFQRKGNWYMSYCYNTTCQNPITVTGVIGVDRNSVGNIATIADPKSGTVRFVGLNADRWKSNFRSRKARLMRSGRKRLVSKLRRKQSNRTRYENHRAAKTIVAFAAKHCSAIALENLNLTKGAKRYADTRQWAHAQLGDFIQYKAALRGVPIIMVNPAYTSQDCSRCGSRNKPNGKCYSCSKCGSKTHRDANSGFNIAMRGYDILSGGNGDGPNVPASGHVGVALSGNQPASAALPNRTLSGHQIRRQVRVHREEQSKP